jgi:hypothetical protein
MSLVESLIKLHLKLDLCLGFSAVITNTFCVCLSHFGSGFFGLLQLKLSVLKGKVRRNEIEKLYRKERSRKR